MPLGCTPLGGETDPKGANQTPYGPVPVGASAAGTHAGSLWMGLGLSPGLCGALQLGAPGRGNRGDKGVSAHTPVWLAS